MQDLKAISIGFNEYITPKLILTLIVKYNNKLKFCTEYTLTHYNNFVTLVPGREEPAIQSEPRFSPNFGCSVIWKKIACLAPCLVETKHQIETEKRYFYFKCQLPTVIGF